MKIEQTWNLRFLFFSFPHGITLTFPGFWGRADEVHSFLSWLECIIKNLLTSLSVINLLKRLPMVFLGYVSTHKSGALVTYYKHSANM